jgi:hypothetical protein
LAVCAATIDAVPDWSGTLPCCAADGGGASASRRVPHA